ncbi:MAG: ribonuclease HII [Bacteroidetes bacterium 4484_249]|nr:MAG: ribonuclease HII [Bacteroidetes bacterium 4484_249]
MLKPYHTEDLIEAGCDEAGRGCLAGPVFASAVILPKDFKNDLLNDSKKLTHSQRLFLRDIILKQAVSWAVAGVDNNKIDEINILNASILAMHHAVDKLSVTPQFLLIDGNRFKDYKQIPHQCFVKGDGRYLSIAAASILAKTYRDEFMEKAHLEFPEYKWNKNKGYPTPEHKRAISSNGITPYHRKSFRLNEQLKIDFNN